MDALHAFAEPRDVDLYDFQESAIEELRAGLRQGYKRQILCLPTGGGKTECAIALTKEAHAKGSRVAFVADRIALVDQTSDRFTQYGIDHGVVQASNTRGLGQRIQVCSAQTLERRGSWRYLDLLVIDECHTKREALLDFAKKWGGPVIGLTATPMTKGLGLHYERVVNGVTTDHLLDTINPRTDQAYLCPVRIYAAKEIDMRGAATDNKGEWTTKDAAERAKPIIGDIVVEWIDKTQKHFGGPVQTLVFSPDVAVGADICAAFQEAGYDFRQTSYHDTTDESKDIIAAFKREEFTGLVSVDKLAKGYDHPAVRCAIGARAYRTSLAALLQGMGRVMRSMQGKGEALYLDFAGNMAGWYDDVLEFWANGVSSLDAGEVKKVRREAEERKDVVCKGCGLVLPPRVTECPACGMVRKRKARPEVVGDYYMEELVRPGSRKWAEDRLWAWHHLCAIAVERKGDNDMARRFAYMQYQDLYGEPPAQAFHAAEGPPDERVRRKVIAMIRAWRKKGKAS